MNTYLGERKIPQPNLKCKHGKKSCFCPLAHRFRRLPTPPLLLSGSLECSGCSCRTRCPGGVFQVRFLDNCSSTIRFRQISTTFKLFFYSRQADSSGIGRKTSGWLFFLCAQKKMKTISQNYCCWNVHFSKNLETIKSLRVLRVLRPLKTIRRVPKLKVSRWGVSAFWDIGFLEHTNSLSRRSSIALWARWRMSLIFSSSIFSFNLCLAWLPSNSSRESSSHATISPKKLERSASKNNISCFHLDGVLLSNSGFF